MNRRTFLRHTAAATVAAAAGGRRRASAATDTRRPNLLLIMADDLGYGHLGCYGQEKIKTPRLDRMAADGMRFTQAYAGASLCAPSRSVLMTGLHGGHTPVRGNTGGIPLPADTITVAELLQAAGYTTGLFGKWGLGDGYTDGVPNRQGFDEFFGYLHQKHAQFYYTDFLWHNEEKYPLPGNRREPRTQYTYNVILDKACEFIRTRKDEPFFCFISSPIPHHEWAVPEESLRMYDGAFDEHPPEFRWREGYAFPDQPKATMAAMISHLDKGVGRVLDLVDELGIADNTLVLFASDNGGANYELACADFFHANGPLRGFKGGLYEGGIRVPAIAWWPGTIAANTSSAHPWYFADIMPTFCELAGVAAEVPRACDGLSFTPTLIGPDVAGRAQIAPEFMYWETWIENRGRACRVGPWKAVWPNPKAPVELYNLDDDPAETNDRAKLHPDIARSMMRLLKKHHLEPPPQIEPDKPDARDYR